MYVPIVYGFLPEINVFVFVTHLCIILTSLHPPTLLAVQICIYLWDLDCLGNECNIATGCHVYEIVVFMGSTHVNVVLLHTNLYYYSHYSTAGTYCTQMVNST